MLQEVKDLQSSAIDKLLAKISAKREITFRAPTGSGKTWMMSDFMNRILSQNSDVIFLVSTLSKGGLAQQNYSVFKNCSDNGTFPKLNPHLISSEIGNEETLFIPTDFNVYVLPRDLYKKGGRLMQGAMSNFLNTMTFPKDGYPNKKIYLIKDECHQATNNLDSISDKIFSKIVNISATPELSRGQIPDVEISDEMAVSARLIKHVELGNIEDDVEVAICKFEEIRENYRNLLGVNSCLIIQISNKDKAKEECDKIESILNKTEHQNLKWMTIVDKEKECKTNDKLEKLPVNRWKDYAKENASTIDIIIFKMVISEGWDIPRACMLYQIRDTKSKQLDEQVMGRVRRNPRLMDFEKLTPEAQTLATTAWVWGIVPDKIRKTYQVKLFGGENDIPSAIKLKTTCLKSLTQKCGFDISEFIKTQKNKIVHSNVFDLYSKLQKCDDDIKEMCYDYAGSDINKWFLFCENIDAIKREYNQYICNYNESMMIVKNENGVDKEVSFPMSSLYVDNKNYVNISDWVWKRKDGVNKFSFDSEAEREWASILKDISTDTISSTEVGEPNPQYGQMRLGNILGPKRLSDETKTLWGKNFLANSEIKYEYYYNGIHSSYPDFIMKDKCGNIHLFEVKSVNKSSEIQIDQSEYEDKVRSLKECYKRCSELTGYYFYLPILKDEIWQIIRYYNGDEDLITIDSFKSSLKER